MMKMISMENKPWSSGGDNCSVASFFSFFLTTQWLQKFHLLIGRLCHLHSLVLCNQDQNFPLLFEKRIPNRFARREWQMSEEVDHQIIFFWPKKKSSFG